MGIDWYLSTEWKPKLVTLEGLLTSRGWRIRNDQHSVIWETVIWEPPFFTCFPTSQWESWSVGRSVFFVFVRSRKIWTNSGILLLVFFRCVLASLWEGWSIHPHPPVFFLIVDKHHWKVAKMLLESRLRTHRFFFFWKEFVIVWNEGEGMAWSTGNSLSKQAIAYL